MPAKRRLSILTVPLLVILCLPVFTAPVHAQGTISPVPTDTLRQLYAIFNLRDTDALDEYYVADYLSHVPSGDTPEVESFRETLIWLQTAMPDFQIEVEALIGENDLVFSRIVLVGTFKNDLLMADGETILPATGQPFILPVHTIEKFDDMGHIAEEWVVFDSLNYLSQLGILPLNRVLVATPEAVVGPVVDEIQLTPTPIDEITIEAVLQLYEDVFSTGDVQAADDFMTPDLIHWERGNRYNLDDWKALVSDLHVALPDLSVTPTMTVVEGNLVAVYFTMVGTMTGSFTFPDGLVVAPTKAQIELPSMMLFRFGSEGKVVETWNEYDSLDLLAQMSAGPGE